MNRAFLLGLGALLCAVAWLWWSDPSKSALSEIVAGYQTSDPAPREAVEAQEISAEQESGPDAREEIEASSPLAPLRGQPISSVRGEVTGGSEVFPGGDRSGVQVYCWPGWYAKQPNRLDSLDDAPGIQVATTDAAGRFSFELYVDDAHWLIAVADGKCSSFEGMRIGTKPDLEVSLEMRRMFGTHYRVALDPSDPRPIDLVNSGNASLLNVPNGLCLGPERFPHAFFPGTRIDGPPPNQPAHTSLFAWVDPTAPEPLAAVIVQEIPGCYLVKETVPLRPVSRNQALPTAKLQAVARSEFGELVITARGIPKGLGGPLGAPLSLRMRGKGSALPFSFKLQSLEQFPLRYTRIPVGEYSLDAREHSGVTGLIDASQLISIRAGKLTEIEVDFGDFSFLVFERDLEITDLRYLTPPRVRVPNHQESSLLNWDEPRQLIVLAPTSKEIMQISGSVFLDGPLGPREEGRVITYTAGVDDD